MDRYRVKWIDSKHYVVDTKRDETIVSSGYHNQDNAEIVCDKKNMNDDLCGIINMKL